MKLTENKNYSVQVFVDKDKKPQVPFSPGLVLKSVQNALGENLSEAGRVLMKGDIMNMFQEFEKGEGWTGYDLMYAKFMYKTGSLTVLIWDKGTKIILCGYVDPINEFDKLGEFIITEDQLKMTEKIVRDINSRELICKNKFTLLN